MSMRKSRDAVTVLSGEIRHGKHGAPGTYFPTVREIGEMFDLSLVTAQRTVSALRAAGLLERRGRRLVVAFRSPEPVGARRIGVLVTNIDNPFFSRLLNAVEMAGRRREIEIISAGSNYDLEHEARQLQVLAASGADGFLICPAHDVASGATLRELSLPFVLIGRRVRDIDSDAIMVNDFDAGRMVAQHLIERGCRDFLYVGIRNFSDDMRLRGFAFELHSHEISLTTAHCIFVDIADDGEQLAARLRGFPRHGVTGVFCYHDLLALRMIRAARLCGIDPLRELAVVGFDDLPVAAEAYPSISSISYPIDRIAENALESLLRRTDGHFDGPGAVSYLDPSLVVRESSFVHSPR